MYACPLYAYNCILQIEQHEPKGQTLFCLGNVTKMFDVTPSNQLPRPLSPPFHFVLFKFKDLVAKQHPADPFAVLLRDCVTVIDTCDA